MYKRGRSVTSLFNDVWNKMREQLFRPPRTSRRASVWELVIGCLALFYAPFSYLLEPSYTDFALLFLGLMLVCRGLANLVHADLDFRRKFAALLRATSLLSAVLIVVFVAVDLLAAASVLP